MDDQTEQRREERRRQTLTTDDLLAIRDAVGEIHKCRFHISDTEFEATWPMMRELALNVAQAKKITMRLTITGLILCVFSALGRGIWVWFTEIQASLPKP